MYLRCGSLHGFHCTRAHFLVRGKYRLLAVWDLAASISQHCHIHVMLYGLCGYNDIPNINSGVKRTGNSGIDDLANPKPVDQDLGADRGIHLSHAAFHDNHIRAVEPAFTELHSRDGADSLLIQCLLQRIDFLIHCTDDSGFGSFLRVCFGKTGGREHKHQQDKNSYRKA